jgi:hypothetical protein
MPGPVFLCSILPRTPAPNVRMDPFFDIGCDEFHMLLPEFHF